MNNNKNETSSLFKKQDTYKRLLTKCTNEIEEEQIRKKLEEIQQKLNFIYIN